MTEPETRSTAGPLAGIRVLDLTVAMAGPMCTQRLGEMGAQVIKVEAPGGGDLARGATMAGITKFGDAVCFVTLNRNKRSLVLNLKSDEGRAVLHRLVATADVLVQNYRPRVARKLAIDYGTLKELNPRLVYASINGYGEDGIMKERPGQDLLLQSFTGLTLNGGTREGLPQASPLYMVDVTASHVATEGVLAALVARATTGRGQEIKVSMLAAIMEMQCQEITCFFEGDSPATRGRMPQVSIYQEPPYGIYECTDGHLAIAQADLNVLADVLGLPELKEWKARRPAQANPDAVAQWRDDIYEIIAARLKTASARHWDEALSAVGVWCGVVNDYKTFLSHPQTQPHLTTMSHPRGGDYRTVAPSVSFSDNPNPNLVTAPLYGADSERILREHGFTPEEIAELGRQGTIVIR